MDRRRFIKRVAAITVPATVAGCIGLSDSVGDDLPTVNPDYVGTDQSDAAHWPNDIPEEWDFGDPVIADGLRLYGYGTYIDSDVFGVSGSAENTTDSVIDYVRIVVEFYDGSGSPIGVGVAEKVDIQPHKSKWFDAAYTKEKIDQIQNWEFKTVEVS